MIFSKKKKIHFWFVEFRFQSFVRFILKITYICTFNWIRKNLFTYREYYLNNHLAKEAVSSTPNLLYALYPAAIVRKSIFFNNSNVYNFSSDTWIWIAARKKIFISLNYKEKKKKKKSIQKKIFTDIYIAFGKSEWNSEECLNIYDLFTVTSDIGLTLWNENRC